MTPDRRTVITPELIEAVRAAKRRTPPPSHLEIARELSISTGTVSNILRDRDPVAGADDGKAEPVARTACEADYHGDEGTVTITARYPSDAPPAWMHRPAKSLDIHTLERALEVAKVDLTTWTVDRWAPSFSEVTVRLRQYEGDGKRLTDTPVTYTNCHIKVWLKRKSLEARSLEILLEEIRQHGRITLPKVTRPAIPKVRPRRQLEISIMDPHLGLQCYTPGADHEWSIEECGTMVLSILADLIRAAVLYGPYERIIFPFGNDFLHADNVFHTTTAGTPQPEAQSWQYTYVAGEKLALAMVERLREVAPVTIYVVQGNHDRQSAFTLGRLLQAYYHADKDVEVHADASPCKFHHFGVNLIGFEHGHSIRQVVRLAALMANECREAWAQTSYREWHLGDQHRKGSGRPCSKSRAFRSSTCPASPRPTNGTGSSLTIGRNVPAWRSPGIMTRAVSCGFRRTSTATPARSWEGYRRAGDSTCRRGPHNSGVHRGHRSLRASFKGRQMIWQDGVNGAYESLGAFFVFLNILKVLHDKTVRGVSIFATAFFTSWGVRNLYYYPRLGQWCSFTGGVALVTANATWIVLMLHYVYKERTRL